MLAVDLADSALPSHAGTCKSIDEVTMMEMANDIRVGQAASPKI